jgi:hypothetical protein
MKTLTEFSPLVLRRAAAARTTHSSLEGDALHEAIATTLSVPNERAARLIEALDVVGGDIDRIRLVRVFQGEKGPHGAVSKGEFHYAVDRLPGAKAARAEGGRGDKRGGRGDREDRPRGPRGDKDKPRGLGSLKASQNKTSEAPKDDDRPGRGEMPRAGFGWQLTAAPRDPRGPGRGRGGPGGGRRDDRSGRGPRRDGAPGQRADGDAGRGRPEGRGPGGRGPGGGPGGRGPGGGPGGRGPGGRGPGGPRPMDAERATAPAPVNNEGAPESQPAAADAVKST